VNELIADLPYDDRPRERLSMHGADMLSDAELLAILLGSGARGKNALQLGRELLAGGGRTALAKRDVKQLATVRGMGPAKAARIVAAFELARRYASRQDDLPAPFDSDALGRSLMLRLSDVRQERVGGVFLDSRRRVLRQRTLFVGSVNHALVSTREVVRCALEDHCVGVVLYHNHPSGDPTPSGEDVGFTAKLRDSLRLCDLELVDHLIVGGNRYLSMRDRGML
jgi:DNA repair protein RadC